MFPWQKQESSPKFALLLTGLEDGVNVDRSTLRQAGITRLHSVNRGEKALEIIRGQGGANPPLAVDLVICAGTLGDMSFSGFMRAFAALGSPPPVMVISGSETELARAISLGAAATVRRPYSLNELTRALEGVRSQKRVYAEPKAEGKAQAAKLETRAKSAAAPAVKEEDNALLRTRNGLRLLSQGRTSEACDLFTRALAYDPLDLEAALGLSRLYRQLDDMEKSHRWLHRAGHICLSTRQADRAEMLFSRLPEKWRGDHEMIEARELLREGDFDAACLAFVNICANRKNMALHRLLGRACQFTSAPDECLREVVAALARAGYESTAQSLAARMLAEEREREWEPAGFLSGFPRLQEVWLVARFTVQALRAS